MTKNHRTVDMSNLKGLAHPLRVQLLEALATYGPATASQLGQRLGESSGSTSYHLRQLERHGFVTEDDSRGTGRERWWQRAPEGISLNLTDFEPNSPERIAAQTIEREWDRGRAAALDEFSARGPVELTKEWYDASAIYTMNMRLTREQLEQFVAEMDAVAQRWKADHTTAKPGTRPVQIHFNAFPVMGSE